MNAMNVKNLTSVAIDNVGLQLEILLKMKKKKKKIPVMTVMMKKWKKAWSTSLNNLYALNVRVMSLKELNMATHIAKNIKINLSTINAASAVV